jgi:NYN domain
VPQKSVGGKNSADIRLVVDAMDMSFQKEHINCFVVCSGDSDFSPLVSKLKENNKYVIGLGVKNSTSELLIENCDEFIFYEDLVRVQQRPMPAISGSLTEKLQDCFGLVVDAVVALQRENKELLWGSMVKETMKRKRPSFNESYYGFRTFSHLLEDAQRRGIVILRRDQKSGSYVIEDLGPAARAEAAGAIAGAAAAATAGATAAAAPEASGDRRPEAGAGSAEAESVRSGRRRRGRGGRGRRGGVALPAGAPPEATGSLADDDDDDDGDEMATDSHPALPAAENPAAASGERPGFSLFAWLRKDGEEKKP